MNHMANRFGDSETPLLDHLERDLEREPTLQASARSRPIVEDRTITVVLNATDAAVVGFSLQALARSMKAPHGTREVYDRVGKEMASAALAKAGAA